MHVRRWVLAVALLSTFAAPTAWAKPKGTVAFSDGFPITKRSQTMPVDEIERGDVGIGYTVLAADDISEFGVEVLGVMYGVLGPGQPLILAKLTGKAIEFTGVIAGMSGSPVYIDGRLIGAVSYRFGQFSKEPIAGITPIHAMLDVYGPHIEPRPDHTATWRNGIDIRQFRGRETLPPPLIVAPPQTSPGHADARPIETPIAAAGLGRAGRDVLAERLGSLGFAAAVGTLADNGPDRAGTVEAAPIAPGSPIAGLLMDGDIKVAGIGTVTMVEGKQVYGFGHPFLGWGHVDFPMYTAAIINTLATPAGSYKQGIAAREVGSITQDRLTAIAGRLGESASMVPVAIRLQGEGKPELTNVRVVDNATYLPIMVESAVASSAARRMGYEAGGTVDMDVLIHTKDRTLRIRDTYTADPPTRISAFVARDISNVLATIQMNDIVRPDVTKVEVRLKVDSAPAIATLEELIPAKTVVRPGERVRVTARLRRARGKSVSVPLYIQIPADASPGKAVLFAGGGVEMDRRTFEVYGGRYPATLDDLLGILAERRSARALFGRVFLPAAGLRARADLLDDLPPSALATLNPGPDRAVRAVTETMGPDSKVPFSDVVVGGMSIALEVVR